MRFSVDGESPKFLIIVTQKELFMYIKVPEKISPTSADVQKQIDQCLKGADDTVTYIDDIHVTGETEKDHLEKLA